MWPPPATAFQSRSSVGRSAGPHRRPESPALTTPHRLAREGSAVVRALCWCRAPVPIGVWPTHHPAETRRTGTQLKSARLLFVPEKIKIGFPRRPCSLRLRVPTMSRLITNNEFAQTQAVSRKDIGLDGAHSTFAPLRCARLLTVSSHATALCLAEPQREEDNRIDPEQSDRIQPVRTVPDQCLHDLAHRYSRPTLGQRPRH